jgi:hypothetical protein
MLFLCLQVRMQDSYIGDLLSCSYSCLFYWNPDYFCYLRLLVYLFREVCWDLFWFISETRLNN